MPSYSYHCDNCEHAFDEIQGFNDPNLTTCPVCENEALHRVYRPAQVVFKGSGYYVTDSKGKKATMKNPKTDSGDAGADAKNGKSESKTESKSEQKSETKAEPKKTEKKESSKKSAGKSSE